MEGDYGVCVANKFVLLDDDEGDPLEALQKSEVKAKKEEKGKGPSDKAASDKNKNVKKTTAVVPEKKPEKTPGPPAKREVERPPRLQNQNRPPSSQNAQRPEGDRRPRFPRDNAKDDQPSSEASSRGGFRGHGRGRGGSGGFGRDRNSAPGEFDRFGKREFERHSGSDKTGVKPVVKREGGGAHNWGQPVDQQWVLQKESEAPVDQDESVDAGQANTSTTEVTTEEGTGDNQVEETPADEGANEMTLDEWKATQEKNRTKSQFNIRKPNEGHEDPKWKKMFVLKKTSENENEDDEEESGDEEDHQNKKTLVNIEITFGDQSRRGYGGRRGGRGGRGGRGRGGDRYNSSEYASSKGGAPHVDDQAEFPALGGKA